jgi:hypothetical protein
MIADEPTSDTRERLIADIRARYRPARFDTDLMGPAPDPDENPDQEVDEFLATRAWRRPYRPEGSG